MSLYNIYVYPSVHLHTVKITISWNTDVFKDTRREKEP